MSDHRIAGAGEIGGYGSTGGEPARDLDCGGADPGADRGSSGGTDGGADRGALGGGELPSTFLIGERTVLVADPRMRRLYDVIERLARTTLPILILGESGVGKEHAAAAVHGWSARRAGPLLALNCAALQEGLIESELFGNERGAFTGAVAHRPGLLERADGGTLFLDEVNELSGAAQAKLLRVLEHQRVTRLGGTRERQVDLRVVAASNCDLRAELAAGRFRQDLYFRLSGATVVVPPLRDRRCEIPVLAHHFAATRGAHRGGRPLGISSAAMQRLLDHPWVGNVRELKHAMEYAAALVDGDRIEPAHLPPSVQGEPPGVGPAASRSALRSCDGPSAGRGGAAAPLPAGVVGAIGAIAADGSGPVSTFRPIAEELRALERLRMMEALRAAGGVQRRAAELIGMPVRTFTCKLTQYGLRDPGREPS